MSQFKKEHTLEKRAADAALILEKYPDRIPIICEHAPNTMFYNSTVPALDKRKFLVPNDITVGQFIFVVRKRLQLSPEKAVFFFVNGSMPSPMALISTVYEEQRDEDGFLYMAYSGDYVFG